MTEPAFLLDANICIYLLGGASGTLRAHIERHEPGIVVTSAIAFSEVMIGAVRDGQEDHARRLFSAIPVLPFDERAGRTYATLPFRRARFDRLIAAHALAADLVLITNNAPDFADIPALKIENWTL